jgi:hypothetical protein
MLKNADFVGFSCLIGCKEAKQQAQKNPLRAGLLVLMIDNPMTQCFASIRLSNLRYTPNAQAR